MFGDILKGLQGETSDDLNKIPGFKSDQLDDVFNIAGGVVSKQVGQQMLGGGKGTLMNLFSGQQNNSSADGLQSTITKGITSQLEAKLGMNKMVASGVVGVLLPGILGKITKVNNQTPDDDDSPLQSLFGGGGNDKSDLGGMLNKLF